MKKKLCLYISGLMFMVAGCSDDILTSKEGEPIDPVTNLNYTINENEVTLTWNLPANYPSDIITPVSVRVDIFRDGVLVNNPVLRDAPTSYIYSNYDPQETFRFVVKVRGEVDTDDPYMSSVRLSPGQFVEL